MTEPTREWQMPEPLPCPFCGHVGLGFSDGITYRWGIASCDGCGASAGDTRREYPDTGKWHAKAVEQWNTRAATKAPPMPAITQQEANRIIAALDQSDGGYAHIAAFIRGLVSAKE